MHLLIYSIFQCLLVAFNPIIQLPSSCVHNEMSKLDSILWLNLFFIYGEVILDWHCPGDINDYHQVTKPSFLNK
jgi:hypothetical protein